MIGAPRHARLHLRPGPRDPLSTKPSPTVVTVDECRKERGKFQEAVGRADPREIRTAKITPFRRLPAFPARGIIPPRHIPLRAEKPQSLLFFCGSRAISVELYDLVETLLSVDKTRTTLPSRAPCIREVLAEPAESAGIKQRFCRSRFSFFLPGDRPSKNVSALRLSAVPVGEFKVRGPRIPGSGIRVEWANRPCMDSDGLRRSFSNLPRSCTKGIARTATVAKNFHSPPDYFELIYRIPRPARFRRGDSHGPSHDYSIVAKERDSRQVQPTKQTTTSSAATPGGAATLRFIFPSAHRGPSSNQIRTRETADSSRTAAGAEFHKTAICGRQQEKP